MPLYLVKKPRCCKDITSPMSKRATIRIQLSSIREDGSVQVSSRADNAQNEDARLSSLPANTNSSRIPPTQLGCISYTLSSKSATSVTSHLSSSANTCKSFHQPSINVTRSMHHSDNPCKLSTSTCYLAWDSAALLKTSLKGEKEVLLATIGSLFSFGWLLYRDGTFTRPASLKQSAESHILITYSNS